MKHLTALLLVVIWLVLATTGIALGQSRPQGIVVSPAKPNLSLNLHLSKECLSPKERLTLKFTLDRAAYVYIYNIDAKGKVWLLFPNGFSPNPWVTKGEHTLPDNNRYSIVIQGPPGIEYIQAIASLRPIPVLQYDSTSKKAFLFLSTKAGAFAAKLDTWLKGNLPQGSWATAWARYGVSLGRLVVTSWPPDAQVYVDDHYQGTTQREEEDELAKIELWLPTGYHRISVAKEGFRSRSQTIYLKPCKTESLVFWLEEPGRVSISSFPSGRSFCRTAMPNGRPTSPSLSGSPGSRRGGSSVWTITPAGGGSWGSGLSSEAAAEEGSMKLDTRDRTSSPCETEAFTAENAEYAESGTGTLMLHLSDLCALCLQPIGPRAENAKESVRMGKRRRTKSTLSDLGGLSECNERARGQRSIICGQEFVTHSKRQRAGFLWTNGSGPPLMPRPGCVAWKWFR